MQNTQASVFKKIRLLGVSWLLSRLLQEAERGTTALGKFFKPLMLIFYLFVLWPVNKVRAVVYECKALDSDSLYLFYDLEVAPVTFDIAWALVLAEKERKRKNLSKVHIVFVPGKYQGLREETSDYEECIDIAERHWRRDEILFPICHLLPTCAGITYCATREEALLLCERKRASIYPKRYSASFPTTPCVHHLLKDRSKHLMSLSPTNQSKRYIEQWLKNRLHGRKLITITLRCSSYMPARNSNLCSWSDFVRQLDSKIYLPIFIPDTSNAFDEVPQELSEYVFFTEPALNLNLRAAIYEMSYLNLGVNNGPMVLCWLNAKCRYLTFKMMVPEVPQTTVSAFKKQGFEIGSSLPFAGVLQKWVWENDDVNVIEREFALMCRLIEEYHKPTIEDTSNF
jgi:hypothetical protein